MTRSVVSLSTVLALTLAASRAVAQEGPAPSWGPPPPAAAAAEAGDQAAIDEASAAIVAGRPEEARRVLDARLPGRSLPPYATIPTLHRIATQMSLRAPQMELPPAPRASQGARGGGEAFTLYSTLFAWGVGTGIYIDVLAELDDARTALWVPILTAAAGITGAWLMDRTPMRRGRPSGIASGLVLGAGFSTLLMTQLNEDRVYDRCETVTYGGGSFSACDEDEKLMITTVWLGATLGMGAGYALAALTDAPPAHINFVTSTGLWGGVLGVGVALATEDSDHIGTAGMLGEAIGIGAGAAIAATLHPSESQTRWMSLGVLGGGLLGAGIAVIPSSEYESLAIPVMITEVGMIAGGVAGYLLGTPDRAATPARTARLDRLRMEPSIAPTRGGAVVGVNLPNLL